MPLEIERKFLVVSDDYKSQAFTSQRIKQGYLSSQAERTVRIRIVDENAFLTIKGVSNESGTSRYEWEKKISKADAEELLMICEPGIVDKQRFKIKSEQFIFEVDEFFGANEGLVIAEIELNSENDIFQKPVWLGEEVTGIDKYYNSMLIKRPYTSW
jgi:CYTH domain-containing protein